MKDFITKDELIAGLESWYGDNPSIALKAADHIMPEFKPEKGKVYAFSDMECDPQPLIRRFSHKSNGYYVNSENDLRWKYCRPLTPEEIGK